MSVIRHSDEDPFIELRQLIAKLGPFLTEGVLDDVLDLVNHGEEQIGYELVLSDLGGSGAVLPRSTRIEIDGMARQMDTELYAALLKDNAISD